MWNRRWRERKPSHSHPERSEGSMESCKCIDPSRLKATQDDTSYFIDSSYYAAEGRRASEASLFGGCTISGSTALTSTMMAITVNACE